MKKKKMHVTFADPESSLLSSHKPWGFSAAELWEKSWHLGQIQWLTLFPLPLFYLYLPQISFHVFSPLLLFKIKPHTGGFCHELPHRGHCYLHERAASVFLCWNTTQENGWKQNSKIAFQGDHLTKCMKMYECLNYTLHTNTSISIQSCWHLSPVPPKADVHCLVF